MRRARLREDVEDRGRRARRLAPALEDRGVSRLERERRDLRDGVGPRFEDDGEDAERAGHLLEDEAVVEERPREDAAPTGPGARRRRGRRRPSPRTFASSRTSRSRREREAGRGRGDFFEGGAEPPRTSWRFASRIAVRVASIPSATPRRAGSSSPTEDGEARAALRAAFAIARLGPSSPSKRSRCGHSCLRAAGHEEGPDGSPREEPVEDLRRPPVRDHGDAPGLASRSGAASSFVAMPPRPRAPPPSAYRATSSVIPRRAESGAPSRSCAGLPV